MTNLTGGKAQATHSYNQILKSSAMIGGSSAVNIVIGIIRTKAMALLLGPAGFGLMGLYGSIANMAQSIAGMGINSSGVRQIAEAVGTGETIRIEKNVAVLRRTSLGLGIVGAVLLVVFSRQISTLTFGSDQHTAAIALLSLAVLFGLISAGQMALIQGMRRIADLAKLGVLGSGIGALVSIPIVYFLGEDGVVPALIVTAAMSVVTTWWFSRKVEIRPPAMTASEVMRELAPLLKLGFAFMASGFLITGAAYAVRTIVLRLDGMDAAGLYQSAWTLGGLYVGFILQSMGADFYPRLTAVCGDNAECNRMVNEQAQISLLLAGPGVIATLTFTPIAIALFYSTKFMAAVGVLRWICLGAALQVITWPMGTIIMAKGAQRIFFVTEFAWTVVNVGLAWSCVRYFGVNGAGMAFFGSYLFHGLLLYPIVRRMSGFRWTPVNKRTGVFYLFMITMVFCSMYILPFWLATIIGGVVTLLSFVYTIRTLLTLTSHDWIPRPMLRLMSWFRLASIGS